MRPTNILKRLGAGVAVLAMAAAATVLSAGVANAQAPNGSLTLTPTSGTDTTIISVRTSGGCTPDTDSYNIRVTGPNGLNYPVTTTGTFGFSTTGAFDVAFEQTMRDAAALNTPATTIVAGVYNVTLNCTDSFFGAVGATFTTTLTFTSPTAYSNAAAVATTTTTLAATPASPVTAGTATTLTATVAASSGTPTGSVQFKNGTADVGTPVPVSGGTASTTATLPVGTNSLTAVFTGGTGFGNSTSALVSFQVNPAPGAATTTALSVNPSGQVVQGTPVNLSASVAPPAATGTVQFTDNGAPIGAPQTLSGGTASFTATGLSLGSHAFTAAYTSANQSLYANSVSLTVTITVIVEPGVSSVTQDITTTINAGALVISVPNNIPVVLPSPVLVADASRLETSGSINTVRVSDTRAGNPGWTASGQVSDFTGSTGSINGANLGWGPQVVGAQTPFQVVTAGPVVNPALAILPGATAPAGVGLTTARTLASAAPGFGTGTADLDATLALNVPTTTTAGTYTATLTLTAI